MARFKRKARRAYSYMKKSYRKHNSSVNIIGVGVMAFGYGMFRNKVHSYIPDTGIPYSDSLISGAVGYYLAKKQKGMLKNLGIAILVTEASAIGNTMGGSFMGGSDTTIGANQDY